MKIKLSIVLVIVFNNLIYSQVKTTNNIWAAKEFSKEISLFKSKEFLFNTVLGSSEQVVKFEVTSLAAANSGELTTLLYKCESKQKEGLILGFYGDYWNEAGVLYQGYSFKHLEKDKATQLLNKIKTSLEENSKFLEDKSDNNNIYFKYDDMNILIWTNGGSYSIRIFWQGFDSTWEKTAFERSKRRFEKKIK